MELPEQVKIGGINYEVLTVDPDHKKLLHGECWGYINHGECKVYIANNLSSEKQQEVLTHEILHGIFDFIELGEEIEEDVVLKAGRVLYQVLKDNNLNMGEPAKIT